MNHSININIVSDSKDTAIIDSILADLEYSVESIDNFDPSQMSVKGVNVLLLYLTSNDTSKWNTIFKQRDNLPEVVLFIFNGSNASTISSIARLGFNDIYVFPFDIYKFDNHFHELLNNIKVTGDTNMVDSGEEDLFPGNIFFSETEESQKLKKMIHKIATETDSNLLLLGETGTGKGNYAKYIHHLSTRRGSPFVDIICNSIPSNLLESELFGYEKGAFTDAKSSKIGLFEVAEDGTIFLDEIGDLSVDIQSKLLRVIEKKYFRRIGGTKEIPINARIISSSNKNLAELIRENIFRRDLYYRLNTFTIELPPLRKKPEEISFYLNKFLVEYSDRFAKQVPVISDEVSHYLSTYNWPGNIRELRHTIERAVLLGDDRALSLDIIRSSLDSKFENPDRKRTPPPSNRIELSVDYKKESLETIEQIYAKMVLKKENGNKSKTAKILGISRPKLDKLLK